MVAIKVDKSSEKYQTHPFLLGYIILVIIGANKYPMAWAIIVPVINMASDFRKSLLDILFVRPLSIQSKDRDLELKQFILLHL